MAWRDAPRKPNGLDRFIAKRSSIIDYARQMGWGELGSIGESGDCFVFNFADHTAVRWRPPSDPTTDNQQGTNI
jgi:hypothetical protein